MMDKSKETTAGRFEKMPVVHTHAAGIDVGSRSHFVAVGQTKEDVKEFGAYTDDLHQLCKHLVELGITTVALESTGSYWQPLFVLLQQYKLNPILVNGKFTKNVKGRKTDVQDCQWIQKLHSLGLLTNAFRPDGEMWALGAYVRQRADLLPHRAAPVQPMQKAFQQMNIQLAQVLTDIMGETGLAIVAGDCGWRARWREVGAAR